MKPSHALASHWKLRQLVSQHGELRPQETLALLKILALGQNQIARSKVKPLGDAIRQIKARRRSAE